jgi:hypothetical protein
MVFGQHFKLVEGRTGPVYRTQQNGDDASLACLVLFRGPLDFHVVARNDHKFISDETVKSCRRLGELFQ